MIHFTQYPKKRQCTIHIKIEKLSYTLFQIIFKWKWNYMNIKFSLLIITCLFLTASFSMADALYQRPSDNAIKTKLTAEQ